MLRLARLSGRPCALIPAGFRGRFVQGPLGRGDGTDLPVGRRRGAGSKRGALRPHNHHSFGRVYSGHRRRGLGTGAGDGSYSPPCSGACRSPVVGLLRPPHAGSRAEALRSEGRGAGEACAGRLPLLPLPMVAGIILVALGIKQTPAHVGDPSAPSRLWRCAAGVALYPMGHNAFRLRDSRQRERSQLVVTVFCLAALIGGVSIPPWSSWPSWRAMVRWFFETMRSREFRARAPCAIHRVT